METNPKYFHFTLGPVQSFVGQARRTRDFWAGSFILSWLSGVAMAAVENQGGEIIFPKADEAFLHAIKNGVKGEVSEKLQQGGVPNRFKAEVLNDFDPQQVINAVNTAWQALADKVYKEIEPFAQENTKQIWDRQVNHFWDMAWVLVDDKSDSASLDQRKNWRSHIMPQEPGIKCSLMGDWQELSGICGVSKRDRENREFFWQQIATINKTDFTKTESLCAISFIKRRFIDAFKKLQKSNNLHYGWSLPRSVPSVMHIASAPWLAQTATKIDEFFINEAKKLGGCPEYDSTIQCLQNTSINTTLKGLDGSVFFEHTLDNPNVFPNQEQANKVKAKLKNIIKKYGKPTPFYAVLAMDGDSLGAQMSDLKKQEIITSGLAEFTKEVPKLVEKNNGFLIYAGGDDVLALVSLEDALCCALKIREHYEACFKAAKQKGEIETSISAAITYVHTNYPLKNVLQETHDLLDEVAKEKAGRDAIAITVHKGSGEVLTWAKKWDKTEDDYLGKNITQLLNLVKDFSSSNHEKQNTFSNQFFYKIREQFAFLQQENIQQPIFDDNVKKDLMAMHYLKSLGDDILGMEKAKEIISPLMGLSKNAAKEEKLTEDAALLIRFLAQKGIDGEYK